VRGRPAAVRTAQAAPRAARRARTEKRRRRSRNARKPTAHVDAGPLLDWLAELRPCIGEPGAVKALAVARRRGTITPAAVDRLCVLLDRPEMPALLYPDA